MKKTYWWRVLILLIIFVFILVDYFTYCDNNIRKCFWDGEIYLLRTLFHFSMTTFLISLVTFFVNDNVFLRWFKFGIIWFFSSLFFVSITPEYSGGWVSFTPDREQVSIWMSALFLIISLISIAVWSIKEKKLKK
jgi:hypothetical protein